MAISYEAVLAHTREAGVLEDTDPFAHFLSQQAKQKGVSEEELLDQLQVDDLSLETRAGIGLSPYHVLTNPGTSFLRQFSEIAKNYDAMVLVGSTVSPTPRLRASLKLEFKAVRYG